MTDTTHPLDQILQRFPGFERVTLAHRDTLRPGEGLPIVLAAFAITRGTSSTVVPEAVRCELRFTDSGIKLTALKDIGTGQSVDTSIWNVSSGATMQPYFLNLELCVCPSEQGGARHNPLAFALVDTGISKGDMARLMPRWLTLVRRQPQLFCGAGVEALKTLKVI